MWIYQLKIVIFHGFLYVYQGVYIYIIGWWCNFTILKNDGVRQWVSDDIPYMMEKKDWNHQPDNLYLVHVQPHPQRFESVQGGAPPVMFVGL